MPEPLHAPPPEPPDRTDRRRRPPAPDEEPLDPTDDVADGPLDLEDDALGDEADPFEGDFADDEPLPDDLEPFDRPLTEADPLEDGVDDVPADDGTFDDDLELALDDPTVDDEPPPRVVLPWRTQVTLEPGGQMLLRVPAVLDPTAERTMHVGGPGGAVTITVGEVVLAIELLSAPPDGEPYVRVGRDVLAGRILVES